MEIILKGKNIMKNVAKVCSLFLMASILFSCSEETVTPVPQQQFTYKTTVGTKTTYDYFQDSTTTEAGYFQIGQIEKLIISQIQILNKNGFVQVNTTIPQAGSPAQAGSDTAIYTTENGNILLYIDNPSDLLAGLVPDSLKPASNPRWLNYLRPQEPIGQSYVISTNDSIDIQFPLAGIVTPIKAILNVSGVVEKEETIMYKSLQYKAKKIIITVAIQAFLTPGGAAIPLTFVSQFWVADSLGIVRNDYAPPALPGQTFPRFRQIQVSIQ